MLKFRLPSGIFMGLMVLGSIFLEGQISTILFLIIGIFLAFSGVYEYLSMLKNLKLESYKKITATLAAVILSITVLNLPPKILIIILSASVFVAWFMFVTGENKKLLIIKTITSISALPMLVLPLFFLAKIYTGNFNGYSGKYYFLFLIIITKIGDIGAYTVGMTSSKIMKNGNHKILPKISPKKSWEGTIGGMLFSIAASILFCHFEPDIIPQSMNPYAFSIIAGALLFVGGFIGDLTESALKRACEVKDSGKIIPGMGGALDVIDSLLLNAPLFYTFLIAIQ